MQCIRNVLTAFVGLVLYAGAGHAQPSAPSVSNNSLCDTSRQALSQASAIRELAVLNEVPCDVQDKPAVESFLLETIRTELPPQALSMEELTFKTIGLLPDDTDYSKQLIDFLVGQIGGYYDPKKKRFVMASWLPSGTQMGVAVHELTHALQDQHHNIQKLLTPRSRTTDSDLATSALIEGEASAVMFDYQSRSTAGPTLARMASVDSLLLLQVLGVSFGSQGASLPDGLKGLLVFPYTSGLRFAHSLLKQGGYRALDAAYARPPQTSREILHPEEYTTHSFQPDIPKQYELPGYSANTAPVHRDTLGEFGISSVLSGERVSKASAARIAQGWVGDLLGVFPELNGQQRIAWIIRWETPSHASEFFSSYTEFLSARYSVTPGAPTANTRNLLLTPRKSVRVSLESKTVTCEFTLLTNAQHLLDR